MGAVESEIYARISEIVWRSLLKHRSLVWREISLNEGKIDNEKAVKDTEGGNIVLLVIVQAWSFQAFENPDAHQYH